MRGDLDWIVMKALEKDRNRRYETALGLAADVQRHLSGEAVQAHPPSAAYRLRKLIRRNRPQFVAVGLIVLALVVGVVGTTFGLLRSEQRRRDADQARANEAIQRGIAEAKTAEAQQREAEANRARWETLEEQIRSDIKTMSLQVDLDLIECRTDPKVGLLRLAKPMRDVSFPYKTRAIPIGDDNEEWIGESVTRYKKRPDYRPLREFVTVAILAHGQDFAPLLPPITHDGRPVVYVVLSADHRTLLTLGKDYTARLWDVRTARRKRAQKRIGTGRRFELSESDRMTVPEPDILLAVDEALTRLAAEDSASANVARLRLFAGLSVEEAAGALGVSRATAFRDWAYARAWLTTALS
jgi:hypothetical protein